METLLITAVSELITLAGVIITCLFTHSKTIYRIEQLEKKQDKYNNVIARTYELEKNVAVLKEEINQ
jgi:hypothetical protein